MATVAELDLTIKTTGVTKAGKKIDKTTDRVREFNKVLDRSRKLQGKGSAQMRKTGNAAAALGGDFKNAAAGIGAAALAMVTFAGAIKAAGVVADFSEAIALVGGVTKASATELAAFEDQARSLGATTRFSASQAAGAQLNLARAGLEVEQVVATTTQTLNLAAAAQLDLARAAEITALTMNQFGLSADQATRVTDVLVSTSNNAATDVNQLAEAMKFAGVIGAGFGKSLEEVSGALGILSNAGLQASQAGTGLRGVMASLARPSGIAKKQLESLAEASGQTVDAFDITQNSIENVAKAFKRAEAGPTELLAIFGKLQAPAAIVLVESADKIGEFTDKITASTGEAETLAGVVNDTLKGAMLSLNSAIEELFLSIGDSGVGGAFAGLVEIATQATRVLGGVEGASEDASASAQLLAVGVKAATAALVAFGLLKMSAVLVDMGIKLNTVTIGFKALRGAIATSGLGTIAVVAGIAATAMFALNDAVNDTTGSYEELFHATKKAQAQQHKDNVARAARLKERRKQVEIEGADAAFAAKGEASTAERLVLQKKMITASNVHLQSQALEEKKRTGRLTEHERILLQELKTLQKISLEMREQAFALENDLDERAGFALTLEKSFRKIEGLSIGDLLTQEQIDRQDAFIENFTQLFDELQRQQGIVEFDAIGADVAENARLAAQEIDLLGKTLEEQIKIRTFDEMADQLGELSAVTSGISADIQTAAALQIAHLNEMAQAADVTLESLVKISTAIAQISENAERQVKELRDREEEVIANAEKIARDRFLQTIISDGKAAEQTMLALADSVDTTGQSFDDFKTNAEIAIAGYTAQLERGTLSQKEFDTAVDDTNASVIAFEENLQRLRLLATLEDVAKGIGDAFGDAFEEIITGSKSATEAARDFAIEVSRILLRQLAIEPLVKILTSGLTSFAGAALGGGAAAAVLPSANGNAFGSGNVLPFRRGGIIGGPTTFPLGLAGEAGPEAILPLQRGSNGKLGVAANTRPMRGDAGSRQFVSQAVSQGASSAPSQTQHRGGSQVTNISVNIAAQNPNSFRKSERQIANQVSAIAGGSRRR